MPKEVKHKYLVGYRGDGQVLYGKNAEKGTFRYAEPLTLNQAEWFRRKMPCKKAVIFRVEEIKNRKAKKDNQRSR